MNSHHHESPPTLSSPTAATTPIKLPPTGTTVYVIVFTSVFSLLLLLALSSSSLSSAVNRAIPDPFLFPDPERRIPAGSSPPSPPSIVYFVSGTAGQSSRILRLLLSLYHPKNYYLLHLDRIARDSERELLAESVRSYEVFRAAHNVEVLGKADFAYAKGSSPVSTVLRGAAVSLRLGWRWDWFICVGALDYPVVTQDGSFDKMKGVSLLSIYNDKLVTCFPVMRLGVLYGNFAHSVAVRSAIVRLITSTLTRNDLLHILSYMPRDLNFMNHTSYIGWRESRKLKPIIVDPGLYIAERTEMFYASQKRDLPDAYTLFTASNFNILSRSFVEFLIMGTDNFPRTLLMYMANTPYSFSSYFPTVLCNSRQFNKTVINHNLLYTTSFKSERWKTPLLSSSDFDDMTTSGAAFASPFSTDESILNRIDSEILGRSAGQVLPGGWCLGGSGNDTCSIWGDADILRPGPGARRLEKLLVKLLSNGTFLSQQCIIVD